MQGSDYRNEIKLSLLKMISTHNMEEQISFIVNWLRQHYSLNGIGFFIKKSESSQAHFFTETIPMHIVQNLEEMLVNVFQAEEAKKDAMVLVQKEGRCIAFSPQETPDISESMGIIFPLDSQIDSMGALILFSDPRTIRDLISDSPMESTFVPIISSLLHNALSHEIKDSKIRMLNLYQTVSSSLAYISDLQELLTTITGIVTSELLCEECSVLLYDEVSNEFEFFSAFGETGMTLVSERFPADKGIAGRALRERKSQIVNDVQSDPDFYGAIDEEHDFKTKSILAAPLIAGEEPVGILNAINKIENQFFDKEDDQILSAIADEIALAVKHARLFEYVVENYCKIKQGKNSCKDCKRPLKSWTPCARHLGVL